MLKIREEQMRVLARGVAHIIYLELLAELQEAYPERDDLPEFFPDIVDIASLTGFAGRAEVMGLAHLMMREPEELSGTFWSQFLQPVLFDRLRSGEARLRFIHRYLLPRIERDRAEGRTEPPPLPGEQG